jgi:hypothetical protein
MIERVGDTCHRGIDVVERDPLLPTVFLRGERACLRIIGVRLQNELLKLSPPMSLPGRGARMIVKLYWGALGGLPCP